MKRACVLGMGASGEAAKRYLTRCGYEVLSADDRPSRSDCPIDQIQIESFSLFVPSPGVPRSHPLYVAAQRAAVPIAGEMELALRELSHHRCIGVTGTNGKTTVVRWMEQLLQFAKIPGRAVGNVGEVILDYLQEEKPEEVLIVEISSYQLETMQTAVFDLGFLLNITEDHLSRYASYDAYGAMKCHLENCVRGTFYVQQKAARDFGHHLKKPYRTYTIDPAVEGGRWTAPHDLENATAVWILAQYLGISLETFRAALETFQKPSHRIETVLETNGILYIDDSKGTNVDAVLKALASVDRPVVLLLGGVDKGASFAPIHAFQEKIVRLIAFGQCREKVVSEFQSLYSVDSFPDMASAVRCAITLAQPGQAVLLSPGCASYDEFNHYAHRGDVFKKIVLTTCLPVAKNANWEAAEHAVHKEIS